MSIEVPDPSETPVEPLIQADGPVKKERPANVQPNTCNGMAIHREVNGKRGWFECQGQFKVAGENLAVKEYVIAHTPWGGSPTPITTPSYMSATQPVGMTRNIIGRAKLIIMRSILTGFPVELRGVGDNSQCGCASIPWYGA